MLLLMSFMLQIWMKLMVLMLLMMSKLDNHDYDDDTDDDKAWRRRDLLLAGQPAGRPAGRTLHTLRTFRKEQNSPKKV